MKLRIWFRTHIPMRYSPVSYECEYSKDINERTRNDRIHQWLIHLLMASGDRLSQIARFSNFVAELEGTRVCGDYRSLFLIFSSFLRSFFVASIFIFFFLNNLKLRRSKRAKGFTHIANCITSYPFPSLVMLTAGTIALCAAGHCEFEINS